MAKKATTGTKIAVQNFRRDGWSEYDIERYLAGVHEGGETWLARRIDAALRRAFRDGMRVSEANASENFVKLAAKYGVKL